MDNLNKRGLVKSMKMKFFVFGLYVSLLTLNPLPGVAVPLSVEQNIEMILKDQSGLKQEFNFIVLGDSRDNVDTYTRLLNRAKDFKPLFILNTGDIVNEGEPSEYENYRKLIADYGIPILHIPGNHDQRNGNAEYRKFVGEPNWYFDYGNYRFIGLDNAAGKFDDASIAFAKKTLTQTKVCIVAFHKPPAMEPWTVHAMINDKSGGRGGEVMELIKKARVPLVFLGHIHLYDERDVDGVKYIISAGGGAKLYGKYGFGKPEYGFVLVQVRPEGISHRWVPL
jgi:3',5'-cyclic AMP phosphodiesterase CpdA